MGFSDTDADREAARLILAECRGHIANALRCELARSMPNEPRLTGLRSVAAQLRKEREALLSGDNATIVRVEYLYGLLLKQTR